MSAAGAAEYRLDRRNVAIVYRLFHCTDVMPACRKMELNVPEVISLCFGTIAVLVPALVTSANLTCDPDCATSVNPEAISFRLTLLTASGLGNELDLNGT